VQQITSFISRCLPRCEPAFAVSVYADYSIESIQHCPGAFRGGDPWKSANDGSLWRHIPLITHETELNVDTGVQVTGASQALSVE
jgi:hypothetical protein